MAGYLPFVLFTYSISHLLQKDKVLFYYALKGRDGEHGMLANKAFIQVGRTVVLVPKADELEFSEFLSHWKCKFNKKDVFLDKKELAGV
ncbi:MAG: hypothetical protein ABIF10_00790 [Candidatus Woesearchaeota archaeon]